MLRTLSPGPLAGAAPRRPRPACRPAQRACAAAASSSSAAAAAAPTVAAAAAVAAEAEAGEAGHAHAHLSAAAVLEPQLTWPGRTHGCGEPGEAHIGQEMTICGWVDRWPRLRAVQRLAALYPLHPARRLPCVRRARQ